MAVGGSTTRFFLVVEPNHRVSLDDRGCRGDSIQKKWRHCLRVPPIVEFPTIELDAGTRTRLIHDNNTSISRYSGFVKNDGDGSLAKANKGPCVSGVT